MQSNLLLTDPVTAPEFNLPVDEVTASLVKQLVARLGSPDFTERQQATEGLIEIGAPAFLWLRDAYHATEDFEVRCRIEAIVKLGYVDFHVFASFGFLGIQQDTQFTPGHEDDPRIPEGHVGIHIKKVHSGTGADKAGLREGDIIIRSDGAALTGVGRRAVENFGRIIRDRGPGNRLRLTVLRESRELEIDATLGRPPASVLREVAMPILAAQINVINTRFAVWWAKYFRVAQAQRMEDLSDDGGTEDFRRVPD